jgi:hypothetical protein
MKAKLSKGNSKLGTVANVSLTPVVTCIRKAPCAKLCYAIKSQRMYKATRDMRAHNLRAFMRTPDEYFASIAESTRGMRLFRWHVAGDIVGALYLSGMVHVAMANPDTKYLCFTKHYDLCSKVFATIARPSNLTIVFSAWPGLPMDNPLGFPVAYMMPRNGEEPRVDGTEVRCPGNCETCCACWSLPASGRNVVFHQH